MRRSLSRKAAKWLALLARPTMKVVLRMFFDKRYLVGCHFDDGLSGYIWGLQAIWRRSILRVARPMPFPVGLTTYVSNPNNIDFHPDDLNNFQSPGTYFQNFKGRITIGRGSYIAPNVGIITANHDPVDLDRHLQGKNVAIGEGCWIGMNAVILPGVELGPRTIVGAGAVVTKSFRSGNCVLTGNPATMRRKLPEGLERHQP